MGNAPSEQEFQKTLGQITAKAWSDPAFKKRLMADPAAIAKEFGMPLPSGMQLKVVEDTPQVRHYVLPPRPALAELSDEALDQVAGGACVSSLDTAKLSTSVCIIYNPPPPTCGGCW